MNRPFNLEVREYRIYELTVDAPNLKTASKIALDRWAENALGREARGGVHVYDVTGNEGTEE